MRRREFITLLGGAAAAWPLVARAQQSAMPVVGFLERQRQPAHPVRCVSAGPERSRLRRGPEHCDRFRWADGQLDRLPELAADLVRRRVAAIVANTSAAARQPRRRLRRFRLSLCRAPIRSAPV